jgi:hypothetical protein
MTIHHSYDCNISLASMENIMLLLLLHEDTNRSHSHFHYFCTGCTLFWLSIVSYFLRVGDMKLIKEQCIPHAEVAL